MIRLPNNHIQHIVAGAPHADVKSWRHADEQNAPFTTCGASATLGGE